MICLDLTWRATCGSHGTLPAGPRGDPLSGPMSRLCVQRAMQCRHSGSTAIRIVGFCMGAIFLGCGACGSLSIGPWRSGWRLAAKARNQAKAQYWHSDLPPNGQAHDTPLLLPFRQHNGWPLPQRRELFYATISAVSVYESNTVTDDSLVLALSLCPNK